MILFPASACRSGLLSSGKDFLASRRAKFISASSGTRTRNSFGHWNMGCNLSSIFIGSFNFVVNEMIKSNFQLLMLKSFSLVATVTSTLHPLTHSTNGYPVFFTSGGITIWWGVNHFYLRAHWLSEINFLVALQLKAKETSSKRRFHWSWRETSWGCKIYFQAKPNRQSGA